MKKIIFYAVSIFAIIYLFLTFELASAHDLSEDRLGRDRCTSWELQKNTKCIFNGVQTNYWRRTCYEESRLCRPYSSEPCDAEEICMKANPNELIEVCSDWVKINNMKCYSRRSNSWEQSWARSCVQHHVQTLDCSKLKPR
jgi:hypothetical protein